MLLGLLKTQGQDPVMRDKISNGFWQQQITAKKTRGKRVCLEGVCWSWGMLACLCVLVRE